MVGKGAVVQDNRGGPWLWSRRLDLGVFLVPTLVGLVVSGMVRLYGGPHLPDLGWLIVIVGVDVAHVWSTLFRTYLDPIELRRRPRLYAITPLICYALGVALHAYAASLFWRVLAYTAVFHFVRQQAGWVAVYRARAGTFGHVDRIIDDAAVYLAAGVPLLVWHARLPRRFAWFIDGDFIALPSLERVVPLAQATLIVALAAYAWRHVWRLRRGLAAPTGKAAVIAATAVSWYVGIVVANDDTTFMLLNVLPHGVPYFALLWAYGNARRGEAPTTPGSRLIGYGVAAFFGTAIALAFAEETLWDTLVWHDRAWLFGSFWPAVIEGRARDALVPLLALPQATHYVLDAALWRRGAAGAAQAKALGFAGRAGPEAA